MKGRIIVVDDDPVAMAMLEGALTRCDFEVIRAYGAEDALRKIRQRKPDLVLTDLEMPKVNGVALIAMIRKDAEIRRTPVLAVTCHTWDTIGQAAGQVGCDGYISKPFLHQKLVDKVNSCLAAHRAALASPPQPHPGANGSNPGAAAPAARVPAAVIDTGHPVAASKDSRSVFDEDAFLEYVDGDLDHAQRVIAALLGTLPDRLDNIRKAVASRDGEALRVAAHTLKGSVAFFAAPAAVAAAFRLETIGRSGDLTEASAMYFELERALAPLAQALNEFACEVRNTPASRGD